MKHDVETLSPTRVRLTVEVPFDELAPSLDAAYKRIGSQVTIPGFRKGKVPARVIDQRVGRGAVLEEAINDALPAAYEQAVRDAAVYVVGRPEVEVTEIADGDKIAFTAEVDVRPEFDLPDYAGLQVEVADAVVSDEQIDEQLEELRARFGTLAPVERAAETGDVLVIDLAATRDGEPVEDLSAGALSYEIGGPRPLLPGLDDAVTGASAGETRTFTVTPERGELEGVDVDVAVTVNSVRERVLPELNDDFAALASEFDTLAELRADIADRLGRLRRLEQGYEAREKLHEALIDLAEFPLPEGVIAAEVEEHFSDGHGDHGTGDPESHRAEVEDGARRALKSQFLLDRIADAEQVSVGEQDLSAWIVNQAPRYGMAPQAFADALMQAGQLPMAIADVRRGKALQAVLEKARVVDESGNAVDLAALDALISAEDDEDAEVDEFETDDVEADEVEAAEAVEADEVEAVEAQVVEAVVEAVDEERRDS